MSLLRIVLRSLDEHRASTVITIVSGVLASALALSVFALAAQTDRAVTGSTLGFDAVVGARGSASQIVLNAIYHYGQSTGNLSHSIFTELQNDRRIEAAVPYVLGDNYYGYRIVGTNGALFEHADAADGTPLSLPSGHRWFDDRRREAVIGSIVAENTGLGLGGEFQAYHGLVFDASAAHAAIFTVVGVLEPTGTPLDRTLLTPMEAVYRLEGHVLRQDGETLEASTAPEIPEEFWEVSSVLVKLRGKRYGLQLERQINDQGTVATYSPIVETMLDIRRQIGWAELVLRAVALLVCGVAIGSVAAVLYATMNERRRDFAVLRALGARRRSVLAIVLLESAVVSSIGVAGGFVGHLLLQVAVASRLREEFGVVLSPWRVEPTVIVIALVLVVGGVLAGLAPGLLAYRTDVARRL